MPPRARPGNRRLIEAELPPEALQLLRDLCAARGVPAHLWQNVPDLQSVFETHAVYCMAARLRADQAAATDAARDSAAFALGISPDTIESRERRSIQLAYQARPAA